MASRTKVGYFLLHWQLNSCQRLYKYKLTFVHWLCIYFKFNQRLLRQIIWKWQKELEQFAVVLPQTGTVRILPFVVFLSPNQENEGVLQPDFRFWKARFAGKQCVQSRLVIFHCLTAPHSSNQKTHRCCFAVRNIRELTWWGQWMGCAIFSVQNYN